MTCPVEFFVASNVYNEPGIPEADIWDARPLARHELPRLLKANDRYLLAHLRISAPDGSELLILEELRDLLELICLDGAAAVARGNSYSRWMESYDPVTLRPADSDHFELDIPELGPPLRLPREYLLHFADCAERYVRLLDLVNEWGVDMRELAAGFPERIAEVRRLVATSEGTTDD